MMQIVFKRQKMNYSWSNWIHSVYCY